MDPPSDHDKRAALEAVVAELLQHTPVLATSAQDRLAIRLARSEVVWAAAAGRLNAVVRWGELGGLPKDELIAGIVLIYGELPQTLSYQP